MGLEVPAWGPANIHHFETTIKKEFARLRGTKDLIIRTLSYYGLGMIMRNYRDYLLQAQVNEKVKAKHLIFINNHESKTTSVLDKNPIVSNFDDREYCRLWVYKHKKNFKVSFRKAKQKTQESIRCRPMTLEDLNE